MLKFSRQVIHIKKQKEKKQDNAYITSNYFANCHSLLVSRELILCHAKTLVENYKMERLVVFFFISDSNPSCLRRKCDSSVWKDLKKKKQEKDMWNVIEKLFFNCMHVTFFGRTCDEVLLLGSDSASILIVYFM